MAKTIAIEDLARVLKSEFESYSDDVYENLVEDIKETTKECVEDVKSNAQKAGFNDKTYSKDWKSKITMNNAGSRRFQTTVYSPKHYRIAHLLEHGHAKVNGGRVQAYPHIAPAEEKAEERIDELLRKHLGGN